MFVIVHCGKEIEHNAAFANVLFPIRSPSPSPSVGPPTHLLSRVSRACTALSKHGWALNRSFDLTFGTAAVLAQGGGYLWRPCAKRSLHAKTLVLSFDATEGTPGGTKLSWGGRFLQHSDMLKPSVIAAFPGRDNNATETCTPPFQPPGAVW